MDLDKQQRLNELRKKAEEILKMNKKQLDLGLNESQLLKLIHEHEVYQIELELQNEELKLERDRFESIVQEYASETLYKLISENIEDIVTLHDLELKTIYGSPSLERVSGYLMNQFIGTDIFEFFNYKVKENLNFTDSPRFIIPFKNGKSGKDVKLEMIWKPIFAKNGELKSYLAMSRDVSEREFVLEELKNNLDKEIELNQLKSKFISMTSHELRTPLATIQSSADLMEIFIERLNDDKEAQESLQKQIKTINAQLSRLTQIISDVIFTEKNNQGKLEFLLMDVNLKSLILQLVFNHFVVTEGEPILQLDLGEKAVKIKSDPVLLSHVIRNLIENALKYTPEFSPKPILKLVVMADSAVVQIVDYGIGIPLEDADNIFEPFFRGSNVKNIKGTGLGLSIVYDLVQKLGGDLKFSSLENQGSTFTITFPYTSTHSVGGSCV